MQKSIRTLVLVSALTLSASPLLVAEPMGTNPHPQVATSSSTLAAVAYTVRAYFGI